MTRTALRTSLALGLLLAALSHCRLRRGFEAEQPAPPVDLARLSALGNDPAAMARARTQWLSTCSACHGPTGGGLVGPNLTDGFWLHGSSLGSIRWSISHGQSARGMPAWGGVLGDEMVSQLAAYVYFHLRNTNVTGGRGPQGEPE